LILDTETPLFASWTDIYRDVGLEVSPADWSALLGTAADPPAAYEILEQHLGHGIDRSALRARRAAREAELLAREVPLPGVREILTEAKGRSLRLAVASSSERAWVEGHLHRFGLLGFFDIVSCSDDVERTKPFPDLYDNALRRLGVRPTEAIALEDSSRGIESAKRAGLFCVAVPNAVTRHGDLARADLVVPSLLDCSLDDLIRAADSRPSSPA
jgi:HAD superfamily hydrolase (TIGR01509 family)